MRLIRSIAAVNCMRAACDMSHTLSRLNKPQNTCAYKLDWQRENESEKAAHADWWLLRFEIGKSMLGVNCIRPTIAMTDFNALRFQLMQLCSSCAPIFFSFTHREASCHFAFEANQSNFYRSIFSLGSSIHAKFHLDALLLWKHIITVIHWN